MSTKSSIKAMAGWVLAGLLFLGFGMAAIGKLSGAQSEMFETWGYPAWFAMTIALFEIVFAILLLIPRTARLSILGLTAIMFGAIYTHLTNNETLDVLRPITFLALLWALWLLRPKVQEDTISDTK